MILNSHNIISEVNDLSKERRDAECRRTNTSQQLNKS